MWTFDRISRLEALVDRALAMAEHLRRELADAPQGGLARATLALRIAIVERRLARLRLLARANRHNARTASAA